MTAGGIDPPAVCTGPGALRALNAQAKTPYEKGLTNRACTPLYRHAVDPM